MKLLSILIGLLLTGCVPPTIDLTGERVPKYKYTIDVKDDLAYFSGEVNFNLINDLTIARIAQPFHGIVLDSRGGLVYPARTVAKYIQEHQLDTYVFNECKSACTTIFLAGKNRCTSKYATFAFHKYVGTPAPNLDYEFFLLQKQGVSTLYAKHLVEMLNKRRWVYIEPYTMVKEGIATCYTQ